MLNYLKLEYLKFANNSVVGLLVVMFLIFHPALIFFGKEVQPIPPFLLTNDIFFEFPTIWEYMGYIGNWLVFFFMGFISVHLITSEVTNKTMRQGIINGQTREDFFKSKVTVIVFMSLCATIYYFLITLLIGWFNTKEPSLSLALDFGAYAVLRYFLMCMGYLSFGLLIGIVIRSAGIAILLFISYILFLEPVVKAVIKFQIFTESNFVNYFPMNAIEDLHPLPVYHNLDFLEKEGGVNLLLDYNNAVLATCIYIALFLFLAYRSLKTRDI